MIGYIYKIYDNTNGNVYYGSTKESVSRRMTGHRASYKRYIEGKGISYIKSFDILKNNDYSYSVVEKVEFNEKYELKQRERFFIENNECVNKNIPSRIHKEYEKEYFKKNKDKIIQYNKERYKKNKNKIFQYQKQYIQENKEKIKLQQKEYKEQNKEKIKQYKKEYYEKNKDKKKLIKNLV